MSKNREDEIAATYLDQAPAWPSQMEKDIAWLVGVARAVRKASEAKNGAWFTNATGEGLTYAGVLDELYALVEGREPG